MHIVERTSGDVDRLIEDCLSRGTSAALLRAENLPAAFFDLSSGCAVVCPPEMRFSPRFA